MNKYFEIKPFEHGANGSFYYVCKLMDVSSNTLSRLIGFKNNNDRTYNIMFGDVSDIAYVKRINTMLAKFDIPLRFSQPFSRSPYTGLHDISNSSSRRYYDPLNKKW